MNEIKMRDVTTGAGQDMSRWHALAAGELSPRDAEALRAADPQLYALYQPYGAAAEQRLVDAVLEHLPPQPLPVWVQVWRWIMACWHTATGHWSRLAAVALLASLVLVARPVLRGLHPRGVHMRVEAMRGQDDGPQMLMARDARVAFSIVPEEDAEPGPLLQRGALLQRDDDGRTLPWGGHVNEQADDGSLLVAGTRQTLFACVPEGTWTLFLAIGRPGKTLSEREILDHAGDASAGDFQVIKKRFVLKGPPTDQEGKPCGGTMP